MLIHKPTQRLVLKLSDPGRVTTVIPTAKAFQFRGDTFVAVPHRPDEVRVLCNLGFNAPAPIETYYDWPGLFPPLKAQVATASFMTQNFRGFVLNDMGTGKTLSTLWAFDYLRSIGAAHKLLVVSPLSTLEPTWADEIFKHMPHLTAAVLHGTKDRRLKLLAADVDVYLINHDGVTTIARELAERKDIDAVVVDEVATFRNHTTTSWKVLNRVCAGRKYLWGLTGTPTPKLPTDAWAQCRLISPERVPPYFTKFREMVLKQAGPFRWVPRDNATEIVADAMQPAIRFRRDECVDLPPCVYQDRFVPMTPEQDKAYKTMLAKLSMEFSGQQVVAINDAVKVQKLVQIACGVVYDNNGNAVALPNDPRLTLVTDIIDESSTKVILFVPFKGVLRHIANQLRGAMGEDRVAELSGDTPVSARNDIFFRFQKGSELKVLVAQPAAMSHGLNLTAASTVIWYAPITSNEVYMQANGRITRPGQKHNQLIVNIEGSHVERQMYKRLRSQQNMQGLLLDAIAGA